MPDPVIPKDVAYTIMTGYYPEIASKVKYGGKKKGKGRVGAKFARKRGFSHTTVARESVSMMDQSMKAFASLNPELFDPTGLTSLVAYGRDKKDPLGEKWKYRFTGGSEHYKLYGDQVWYMAGTRDKKTMVTEFLDDKNMTGPQYQQVYEDAEEDMIKTAVEFATNIFNKAWDMAKIKDHIEGASVDAAEEIGFKDGEYDWMTVDEAVKQGYLKKRTEFSKANERDMVKVHRERKEVVATYDVTEQNLDQHGQHGILDPPLELVQAIRDIESGDEDQVIDKEGLKQQVIKMYTKNLDFYNTMITSLKKKAGIGRSVKQGANQYGNFGVDKILKSISQSKSGKSGTPDIARALDVEMKKHHYTDTLFKTAEQTGVEFLAHMLGTINDTTTKKFSQGHRVATLPNGRKLYASVPLLNSKKTLLFLKGPLRQTRIIEGASLTSALRYGQTERGFKQGKETSRSQKHAYTRSKTGTTTTVGNTCAGSANANMNLRKGLLPATSVSIPAGEDLTNKLNEVLRGIPTAGLNIKKIGSSSKDLGKRTYGMEGKELELGGGNTAKAGFWALPYIGVMQSEFEGEQ